MRLDYIYNECCLKTLKRFPDNSINCVVTSPPYNMNLRIRNGKYCSRQITEEFSNKYNYFSDNLDLKIYNKFHSQVLQNLLRVSNLIFYNIQIVTGSKKSVFKMIGDYADYLKDIVVWDKGHAEPSIGQGILNKRTELILIFTKNNSISRRFETAQFKRGFLNDIWQIPVKKVQTQNHKAIFPKKLVQTILKNFTLENEIIYDPFIGTGTTGIVAKSMNRRFIGSEICKKYVDISNKNIKEQTFMPLFDKTMNQLNLL
tara:strand:- start:55 stop:828 length:774 start_codon:yes stop_codon:yes gene_type:complete